jgi:hypothetical protein
MADAPDSLTDGELQSEIELVGDLVVAASSSDGPLSQNDIDHILGVHIGQVKEPADEVEAGQGTEVGRDVDLGVEADPPTKN